MPTLDEIKNRLEQIWPFLSFLFDNISFQCKYLHGQGQTLEYINQRRCNRIHLFSRKCVGFEPSHKTFLLNTAMLADTHFQSTMSWLVCRRIFCYAELENPDNFEQLSIAALLMGITLLDRICCFCLLSFIYQGFEVIRRFKL